MKNRFFATISALSLILTSCQTPTPVAVNDGCSDPRNPASEGLSCSAVFAETDLTPPIKDPAAPTTFTVLNKELTWDKWIDTEIDFLRFYSNTSLKRGLEIGKHETEVWGLENYKAYVNARDHLNSIPIGRLDLSRSLIMRIHELGSEGLKKEARLMGKIMPENTSIGNTTGFKVRQNVGGDPVTHPLKNLSTKL